MHFGVSSVIPPAIRNRFGRIDTCIAIDSKWSLDGLQDVYMLLLLLLYVWVCAAEWHCGDPFVRLAFHLLCFEQWRCSLGRGSRASGTEMDPMINFNSMVYITNTHIILNDDSLVLSSWYCFLHQAFVGQIRFQHTCVHLLFIGQASVNRM